MVEYGAYFSSAMSQFTDVLDRHRRFSSHFITLGRRFGWHFISFTRITFARTS
jgi:hypothetical protein